MYVYLSLVYIPFKFVQLCIQFVCISYVLHTELIEWIFVSANAGNFVRKKNTKYWY